MEMRNLVDLKETLMGLSFPSCINDRLLRLFIRVALSLGQSLNGLLKVGHQSSQRLLDCRQLCHL